ncbi:ATP-binding protein [Paenibacillus sp. sgz500958]|uniref:ATP-binding protein n=1 Tax=Paenibacillus sp. sgz500958 TaxID=3242475 RepID=UPI0036D37104
MKDPCAQYCLPMSGGADIELAMDMTGQYAGETGFTPKDTIFLKLVTEEACTNVIEHTDSFFRFWIKWELYYDGMRLKVIQQGSLFSLDRNSDTPTESSRGRGLRIITSLCDAVEIEQHGSLVSLVISKKRMDS